jgi:hypothetical protein
MINRRYAGVAAGVLALAMAVAPAEAQHPAAVRVPASVLQKYVGEYVYPEGAIFKVGLSGDTLFQEAPGRRHVYAPISETLFRLGPVFTAEFVVDARGGVTQILSDGVAVEIRLSRKGSRAAPPPPPVATVRVPRAVLERYVGTYEFIPGQMGRTDLRVVIRLEGDTLIRSGGGGDAVLTPISETRFRVGDTRLETEFVVDEAGVTQVMGSGFQQLLARLKPQS